MWTGSGIGQQLPERPQVDVEVLRLEAEVLAQLGHADLQGQERSADALDLLVGEVVGVEAAYGLALHELAQRLDQGQHQCHKRALHVLLVRVDARTQVHHRTSTSVWAASALTDDSRSRSDIRTSSTSATHNVTSPATTTPPDKTRSSRSTREIWRAATGPSVMAVPRRGRERVRRPWAGELHVQALLPLGELLDEGMERLSAFLVDEVRGVEDHPVLSAGQPRVLRRVQAARRAHLTQLGVDLTAPGRGGAFRGLSSRQLSAAAQQVGTSCALPALRYLSRALPMLRAQGVG